jgi:hypothetical protein
LTSETGKANTEVLNRREIAAAVADLGGYAPPGSVVPTTIVVVVNDPLANYAD